MHKLKDINCKESTAAHQQLKGIAYRLQNIKAGHPLQDSNCRTSTNRASTTGYPQSMDCRTSCRAAGRNQATAF